MAIVEALKKFGVSLLGENYTPTEAKTDSQIAETIEGISKAIDDAGGIGGGGGRMIVAEESQDPYYITTLEPNLIPVDFVNSTLYYPGSNTYSMLKQIYEMDTTISLYYEGTSCIYDKETGVINVPD